MLNIKSNGDNLQDSSSENGELLWQDDTVSLAKSIISMGFKETIIKMNWLEVKYWMTPIIYNFNYIWNKKQ